MLGSSSKARRQGLKSEIVVSHIGSHVEYIGHGSVCSVFDTASNVNLIPLIADGMEQYLSLHCLHQHTSPHKAVQYGISFHSKRGISIARTAKDYRHAAIFSYIFGASSFETTNTPTGSVLEHGFP
ncbi:hypothetical protein RF11_07197 [Thelohanellus kitauei]|uniref:Uncharacterized protein n=1 Tax=Thelohanellus kitauei TaxID=669202 RepID=A0A0C2MSK3_THEKT|nr:hypothetical protein RF11_07197 [Thelohanellus kitauei]